MPTPLRSRQRPLATARALRFALPLALAACAACSGPVPVIPDEGGPYRGIPAAADDGMTAEAQPVAPTGDDALDDFLADLAAAIDRHDWMAVARAADPEAWGERRARVEASGDGSAPHVVADMLDLGDLASNANDGWDGLDTIRVVTLREVAARTPGIAGGEGFFEVSGDVRLTSGGTLPIRFRVAERGGAYALLVP